MAGIFPNSGDGGIPPNTSDPSNPAKAYPPATVPSGTAALYYGNGCDVRLRPEVLNSIISEIEAAVDQAGVSYNTGSNENLEHAIRYLIQRGLQTGVALQGGQFDYTGVLDPVPTGYNDHMTIIVVPNVNNLGTTTLDINGLGARSILRNDGQQLRLLDLRAGAPALLSYWAGNWYVVGLVASQVPLLLDGPLDLWVRTDGSDETGDGSANDPNKAFKTIQGAWNKAGSRYASTPLFSIHIRLGIPGTYGGAAITGFGGAVYLHGDQNNRSAYKLTSFFAGSSWLNIGCSGVGSFNPSGLTFQMDRADPDPMSCIIANNSAVVFDCCDFDVRTTNPGAALIGGTASRFSLASFNSARGQFNLKGNTQTIGYVLNMLTGSSFAGNGDQYGAQINSTDLYIAHQSYNAQLLSVVYLSNTNVSQTNTTGVKYNVTDNSILNGNNQPGLGTLPGVVASGGQATGVL